MRVEIAAQLEVDGFDRDHLPMLLWTRQMAAIPRIGEKMSNNHRSGVTVVMLIDDVHWQAEGEDWDVAVHGMVIEAFDDDDLTLEEFADRIGVPRRLLV